MAESGTPSENEKKNADAMVLVVRVCVRPTNDQKGC